MKRLHDGNGEPTYYELLAERDALRERIAELEKENDCLRHPPTTIICEGCDSPCFVRRGDTRCAECRAALAPSVTPCEAIGPHHSDKCNGGRVQCSNAQFTEACKACGGSGVKASATPPTPPLDLPLNHPIMFHLDSCKGKTEIAAFDKNPS